MGFKTVAVARGADKEELAIRLGAHIYIDSSQRDPAQALQRLGGANAIVTTAPSGKAMGEILPGLKSRGKLLVVGVAPDPIEASTIPIIFGGRSISGSLTGTAIEEEDTLNFSVLQDIRPMIETMPLVEAPAAYDRMLSGKARFRMVLVTGQ
jgi:D-arabinose 1-dehydrogenase-like Zn-dependent alcohol dehydrogenase